MSSTNYAAGQSAGASIYDVPVQPGTNDATSSTTLSEYKGKVLLVVNVASKCGFTPQYEGLEALNRKYKDQGLQVVGFPCNDYKSQEPGTIDEIKTFCKTKYDVTFPIYGKLHTIGAEQSPLYKYLTGAGSTNPGDVKWNFEKFVISRDGKVTARFPSKVKPDAPELTAAVEKELAAK